MGKSKVIEPNSVVFHREDEYDLRFGIKSDEDRRTWPNKYPLSFRFAALRKNEIPITYLDKLAYAIKDDIEKSTAAFGKVDVVLKILPGALWSISACVMAGDEKELKRIEPALKQEPFVRTNEVLKSVPE